MKFSLLGFMFLIFMTLKLMGIIAWSWWWVTAPLWGGVVLALVVILIAALIVGVRGVRGR